MRRTAPTVQADGSGVRFSPTVDRPVCAVAQIFAQPTAGAFEGAASPRAGVVVEANSPRQLQR